MRKTSRAIVLVFVSLLTTFLLGFASAFVSALALGATALIVPGTGTPNANIIPDYLEHARDYYMNGTACSNTGTSNCPVNTTGNPANPGLLGIDYPATFWPVPLPGWCPGLSCDTWNASVGTGVANLDKALRAAPAPSASGSGEVVVFGYSQGGAVVSTELANIRYTPDLLAKINKVVTIGNIMNPDGGVWSRLSFIPYIPILNLTPRPPMPVDIPELEGKFYTVGYQYDPVVYSPLYWGNPVAVLNAVAALLTVHGFYLADEGSSLAYGYSPTELEDQLDCGDHPGNCRVDQYGNTYVMIPARSLPLTNLVMGITPAVLKPLVKPFVDLSAPVLKVIADLGYDWSGDPSQVRFLSPLPFNPFQNWIGVGMNLAAAAGQGVQAFLADLGVGAGALAPNMTGSTSTINATMRANAQLTGNEQTSVELTKGRGQGEDQESGPHDVVQAETEEPHSTDGQTVVGKTNVMTEGTVVDNAQPEESTLPQDTAKHDEHVVEDENDGAAEVTKDRGEVTKDRGEITKDRGEVTKDRGEITKDRDGATRIDADKPDHNTKPSTGTKRDTDKKSGDDSPDTEHPAAA
ncbi:PE-PPE domain-containing protein [Mycobacterium sp. URHB0021]|jgi:PE-PPE domain-containing protein